MSQYNLGKLIEMSEERLRVETICKNLSSATQIYELFNRAFHENKEQWLEVIHKNANYLKIYPISELKDIENFGRSYIQAEPSIKKFVNDMLRDHYNVSVKFNHDKFGGLFAHIVTFTDDEE